MHIVWHRMNMPSPASKKTVRRQLEMPGGKPHSHPADYTRKQKALQVRHPSSLVKARFPKA